jgi:hypothetical protein
VDLTPPAGDSAAIGTADPAPVAGADQAAADRGSTNPAPAGSPGDLAPPAADLRAALARLWNSTPTAKPAATVAPGPAPAGDQTRAKGPPLAVGAEPPPLRSPAPTRKPWSTPPAGARLYFVDHKSRPCSADRCKLWT